MYRQRTEIRPPSAAAASGVYQAPVSGRTVTRLRRTGTSDGSLLVFQRVASAGAPHLAQRVRHHASAIYALAGDQCHLVSADQSGNIVQWAGRAGELSKLRQIDHYGWVMCPVRPEVCARGTDGRLRIFPSTVLCFKNIGVKAFYIYFPLLSFLLLLLISRVYSVVQRLT